MKQGVRAGAVDQHLSALRPAHQPGPTKLLHTATALVQLRQFLSNQSAFSAARGYEVHLMCAPDPDLSEFGSQEGACVHAVTIARPISLLEDLKSVVAMWRQFRQVRPVIVHAHSPKGGVLGMVGAWLARTPIRVYTIHGLWYVSGRGWKRCVLWATEWLSCSLAHRVLTVSESVRAQAVADRLCAPAKVVTPACGSSNGVEAEWRFNPDRMPDDKRERTRGELGIPLDALVIGFVGRVFRVKGVMELEAAWQSLRLEFPRAHLLLVGPIDPQWPIPEEAMGRLRRDDRVHLTGAVKDPVALYATMDVFTLPSYQEGFGAVLIEAAAMRLPTVATRVLGSVDAVDDGRTGTLVPPRDAEALRDALARYLADPDLRAKHGRAGRERALRHFAQHDVWEAIHREYDRLLEERCALRP